MRVCVSVHSHVAVAMSGFRLCVREKDIDVESTERQMRKECTAKGGGGRNENESELCS